MKVKSTNIQLTRAETEALLIMMGNTGVGGIQPTSTDKDALKAVYSDLPFSCRSRIVYALNSKIWGAWADMHPEEGPFK